MSRTYKYPTESLEDSNAENDFDTTDIIRKKLKRQKHRKKRILQAARSFKKLISYRDKQRARV